MALLCLLQFLAPAKLLQSPQALYCCSSSKHLSLPHINHCCPSLSLIRPSVVGSGTHTDCYSSCTVPGPDLAQMHFKQ